MVPGNPVYGSADVSWFDHRSRRVLYEFQMQDKNPVALSQLDPEQIASELARANVNFVYVNAKDNQGNCYYNTRIGHKHRSLGERDWLAEVIAACKKRDILVGVYFNFSRDNRMWEQEPEWRQRWQDGTLRGEAEQLNPDWDNMCHNSPYRDYILALLKEITANYDIHSYWVDRLDWGGKLPDKFSCACDYCQAKFMSEIGAPIPTHADWNDMVFRKFVQWRSRCLTRYMKEIRHAVKSVKPHVVLSLNYYAVLDVYGLWFHGQDTEDILDYVDSMTPEHHVEREGYMAVSMFTRFCRGASGGKPCELDIFRHSGDLDYITKPVEQMKAEALTTLANGGAVQVCDLVYAEGTTEPHTYDTIGEAFADVKKREPWVHGSRPVKYAALYYSKNSRTYYGRNRPEGYMYAFLGAYKALMEANIPFEVITDRFLNAKDLAAFSLLVMPDAACLSDAQNETVRQYVRQGGNLVATHKTSLLDSHGDPRQDFGLSDVLGVSYFDMVTLPLSYVKIKRETSLTAGIKVGLPLTHRDWQLKVDPQPDATISAVVVYARENINRVSHYCDPPMPDETEFPAVVSRQFGAGRVVYFPGRPDAIFAQYGHPEYQRLLVNAARWAAGTTSPPMEVRAPLSVEATLFEQPEQNRLVVHLTNFQSDAGRSLQLVTRKFMG